MIVIKDTSRKSGAKSFLQAMYFSITNTKDCSLRSSPLLTTNTGDYPMSDAASQVPECPNGARLIPLSQGKFAIVDADLFDELNRFKWFYNSGYAVRKAPRVNGKRTALKMHRHINQTPEGLVTDHRNRNTLDNRRANLRTATRSQNAFNSTKRTTNTTGYTGVYFYKRHLRRGIDISYRVWVTVNYKKHYVGIFKTPEEAAAAQVKAAERLHGEFAACLS